MFLYSALLRVGRQLHIHHCQQNGRQFSSLPSNATSLKASFRFTRERTTMLLRLQSTACEEPPRDEKPSEEEEKKLLFRDTEPLSLKELIGAYGDLIKIRLSGSLKFASSSHPNRPGGAHDNGRVCRCSGHCGSQNSAMYIVGNGALRGIGKYIQSSTPFPLTELMISLLKCHSTLKCRELERGRLFAAPSRWNNGFVSYTSDHSTLFLLGFSQEQAVFLSSTPW